MKIINITRNNVNDYISVLSLDEMLGIDSGRLSVLCAFDEENEKVAGILIAEVYETFIEIVNIRVMEDYRNRNIEDMLYDFVIDMPEELRLPVYSINPDNADFLLSKGFKEQESSYWYLSGHLRDMIDVPKPNAIGKDIKLTTLVGATEEELIEFIVNEHADEFLQFPDKMYLYDRLSSGSIICKKAGKLQAVILMEELNDFLEIIYFRGKTPESLYLCFSVLKKVIENDYDDDLPIRFLVCNDDQKQNIGKLMNGAPCEKIRIFGYNI